MAATSSATSNDALPPQATARSDLTLVITLPAVTSASQPSLGHSLVHAEDDTLIHCPSCDSKIHRSQVASHCEQEMQRLKEMSAQPKTIVLAPDALENSTQPQGEEISVSSSTSTSGNVPAAERRKPWSVFQKVQRNRQSRMKQRTRKRPSVPEQSCPVCNVSFPQDEIQEHAEACLRRSNSAANGRRNSDDHSSNDGDEGGGGEEYEEYEWAGQKRIRVSSLLQGGYAAIGIGQTIRNGGGGSSSSGSHRLNGHAANNEDEDDEDLNVDEDDTQIYGPAQYGESDVIPSHILNEEESDVTSYMRRLITAGSSSAAANNNTARETNTTTTDSLHLYDNNDAAAAVYQTTLTSTSSALGLPSTSAHYQQIIDSLKAKLQHYEQQHVPGKYKCLICLDDYRNPAISVACWHVHCEQCWLRSLGARKLCPQCNLITTPKDLRRIYM